MRSGLFFLLFILFAVAARPESEAFTIFKQKKNEILPGKFTFCRIEYDSWGATYGEAEYDYDGRHWKRWQTDWPESDENFLFRLSELTTIDPNPHPIVRRLSDPDILNYPLIYMSDPGWQVLGDDEKKGLRNYLLRGGTMWVDDFWGDAEWKRLEDNLKEVIPEYHWQPIPKDHPILKIVYPLDGCPQVPAIDFSKLGWRWDPPWIHKADHGGFGATDVEEVHFRGWFDKDGRPLVICTFNTDMGDGFERESEDEEYFQDFSTKAYAMGINIVVYILTH